LNYSKWKSIAVAGAIAGFAVTLPGLASAQSNVVAKVGTLEITEMELAFAEADLQQQFAQVPEDKRRAAILAALIDIKLLANKAIEAGDEKDDKYRSQIAFLQARALHNLFFEKNIANSVTDEEVKARFDKEIVAIVPEKEIKARHILVKTEEEAKEVIKQLEGGADFVELAKEKSTGPSGPQGGDLGYLSKGNTVPEFETAVFALADGEYTKTPVQTQFGWHVIQREEARDKPLPKFEEVSDQIRQVLLREKYFNTVLEARKAIPVEVLDEALKKQIDESQKQ
jgi:peptidyl-prolyl cis-trans isomerase C